MHPYPHTYRATANAAVTGSVTLASPQLPDLASAPPPEFDGPGGQWSPETLLCAAIADCFILTFRSIARASRFDWQQLHCRVEGTLQKADGVARFTQFAATAVLTVPAGSDQARARTLLEKAEHGCLISNSLLATRTLTVEILTATDTTG